MVVKPDPVEAAPLVTDAERSTLAELETVIRGGLGTFVEVGRALTKIRDGGLYKVDGYASFEAYTAHRWDIGKTRAYELIGAAEVMSAIADAGLHGKGKPARKLAEGLRAVETHENDTETRYRLGTNKRGEIVLVIARARTP
jgi:hypothetical protein